jgi:RNA polymerase sigma-70 factor, ECF subfamily
LKPLSGQSHLAHSSRSLSDEELYFNVKRGELSAFDLLYERHKRGLFRFVVGYLKSEEEAEEVFHEAFMQVLNSREVLFDSGSFQGWLYLMARNICLNRMRSRKRRDRAHQQIEAPEPHESAETTLIREKTREKSNEEIQAAVARLPENLSEVLKLRMSGLAYQEIAQTLEIPLGTVKSRFHSIVAFLKSAVSMNDSEVP